MVTWRISGLAAVLVAAGCGKGSEPARQRDGGAGGPTTPGAGGGLAITVDGKARPGAAGFIKRRPDGSFQAYIGEDGSCEQLLTNVFDSRNAYVLVDIATRLAPDGSETTPVTLVHLGGGNDAEPDAPTPATLTGDAAAGSRVGLSLAFAGKGDRGEPVAVRGEVSLAGCGEQDTTKGPGVPSAPLASTAALTVAGKRFPIRGALRKGETIVLSDFPRDCAGAWFIGAALERERGSWVLHGARFAGKISGEAKGLAVTPGAAGTSASGPTVELQLAGTDKLGDYPVAIDGTVQALDCK